MKNRVIKFSAENTFQIFSWDKIKKMQFPAGDWWVKDLIPKNAFTILASVSGAGKSWLAYYIADCISKGENFLGQERFETIKGNVLYLDGENSPKIIQKRGNQLNLDSKILFAYSSNLSLNDPDNVDYLIDIIRENDIDVVIVDTFRAFGGGISEDRAEEIRTFYSRFKAIKDEYTSFIFLDHHRKPSIHDNKMPSKEMLFGSQDKTSGVDVLLMLKRDGNEISVYQPKNRIEQEIAPFKIKMEDVVGDNEEKITTFTYLGEMSKDVTKKEETKEWIVSILADMPNITKEQLFEEIKKEILIGSRTMESCLRELEKEKEVKVLKNGKKNIYSLGSMPQDEENIPAE